MTPKDVVRLATKLVLAPDEAVFSEKGVIRTVYDPACGLLGFISDAIDQINQMGSTATIVPFGQELDPKTHAMALTAMLIRGYKSENIAQGSTLSNDLHRDKRFHYGLANPPFGIKWEKDKPAVEKEHKELGYAGRFGPGLPRVSDGSMLFLMHLVSKMERPENGGGRVGIVLSGSPLFTGDAGSGESEIRRAVRRVVAADRVTVEDVVDKAEGEIVDVRVRIYSGRAEPVVRRLVHPPEGGRR